MRAVGGGAVAATLAAALLTACGSNGPAPECDQSAPARSAAISCEDAVALARTELPADHLAIARIQFLYGTYHPILVAPGTEGAIVAFTFSDGTRQAVQLWLSQGKPKVESPGPY